MTQIRAGDLIVFYGGGFLSRLIRLFSAGPSHVAVVRQPAIDGAEVQIIESTIEDGRNGVQTNPLSKTLATYPPGSSAAVLRLSRESRDLIDWQRFYGFCGQAEDKVRYDKFGLVEFLLREIPVAGPRVGQDEHPQKMVCSAFVTALFEKSELLRGINWSKVSPQDLVEMRLYADWFPIMGRPKLKRFNTI